MSARQPQHPRQQYLMAALDCDHELQDEIVILRKEAADLYNGALSQALVTDDQFQSLLDKRKTLNRFPLSERDFNDLVFYSKSTVGLVGFSFNRNRIKQDGQIDITIPTSIKKQEFDSIVWKAIEPYLQKTKSKGSEQFQLVYAIKKARKHNIKPKEILKKLCEGELPAFPRKRNYTSEDINKIINDAEKSMNFKALS